MKEREYPGWVYVDESAVQAPGALEYWVGLARAYNRTLAPKAIKPK